MDRQTEKILTGILAHCSPRTVILFGEKHALSTGEIKSLDFCVILPEADKPALLQEIYLAVESEVPFQVLLYTCQEWIDCIADFSSYAAAIHKKGTVLYGQEP